ncbi:MAG: peptidylprolyl isomerase, partial [archaeon]|nr:peptidylprolyl isomerase [archaeon]
MKDGDFVNIDYVGKIKESGEVFDLTDEQLAKENNIYNPHTKYGPITVILGAGYILKGLEEVIKKINMKQVSEVDLKPEDAFGLRDPRLVKMFNINYFRNQKVTPIQGQFIDFGGTRGRVLSVASGRVRIDFNHPLAGKALSYSVTVNGQVTDVKEQMAAIVTYYTAIDKDVELKVDEKNVDIILPSASNVSLEIKKKMADEIVKYV